MSPEARAICLRIHQDAARFQRLALMRIELLGRPATKRRGRLSSGHLLNEYIAGRLRASYP